MRLRPPRVFQGLQLIQGQSGGLRDFSQVQPHPKQVSRRFCSKITSFCFSFRRLISLKVIDKFLAETGFVRFLLHLMGARPEPA